MLKIVTLILLLNGCGTEPSDWVEAVNPSPEERVRFEQPVASIAQILNEFLFDCGTKWNADISNFSKLEFIRYSDPSTEEEPNRVGVCWTWTSGGILTKANIEVKNIQPAIKFKALLYHELGHCVLGLDHSPQDDQELMSPALLDSQYYIENWDKLVQNICTSQH